MFYFLLFLILIPINSILIEKTEFKEKMYKFRSIRLPYLFIIIVGLSADSHDTTRQGQDIQR